MNWFVWHWHRFCEWAHQICANRHYGRWKHHRDRAVEHGQEADRIDPRGRS